MEPDVRMNPILLKPTSDTGSQVIVNGEVPGQHGGRGLLSHTKGSCIPGVMEAYESLAAEIRHHRHRGGGKPGGDQPEAGGHRQHGHGPAWRTRRCCWRATSTGAACSPPSTARWPCWSRRSGHGSRASIINKFRGDVEILRPGLADAGGADRHSRAGAWCPMLNVDIDDEDSLSERLAARRSGGPHRRGGDPAAPHLQLHRFQRPGARGGASRLRYVRQPGGAGGAGPDHPARHQEHHGATCSWLRESGLESRHPQARRPGRARCIGICGGYQMLGEQLSDPDGVEGGGKPAPAWACCRCDTVFRAREKTRTRVQGASAWPGSGSFAPLEAARRSKGYEIHMGRTIRPGAMLPRPAPASTPWAARSQGRRRLARGNVLGLLCPRPVSISGGLRRRAGQPCLFARPEGLGPSQEARQWTAPGTTRSDQYDKSGPRPACEGLDMERVYRIRASRSGGIGHERDPLAAAWPPPTSKGQELWTIIASGAGGADIAGPDS